MLRMIFTLTVRNLFKDKLISLVNFSNLAIGFTTFILISLYIYQDWNWDKQNTNYDRLYRLQLFMDQEDNAVKHTSSVTAALARQVLPRIPEIESTLVMHDAGDNNKDGLFLSADRKHQFLMRYGYYADTTIFHMLTFRFIEGKPEGSLSQPYSVVISKSVADKLFPGTPALGRRIYGENKVDFTVTGVYEDLPEHSTLRPAFLIPTVLIPHTTGMKDYETNFWMYSFYTYVLLKKNADPASVDAKIHNALKDYRKEHHPYLRPMRMLHIDPFYEKTFYIAEGLLSLIALLILVLSSVNYVNLQTASATSRLREIGIKKTAGFSKRSLILQFLVESMSVSFLAGLIGVFLAELMLPLFNRVIGVTVGEHIFSNLPIIGIVMLVTLLVGFLSGLYPAWIIASFNPVMALKQKYATEAGNGMNTKKVLVVAQFSISLFLLVLSFIFYRQTNYMLTCDMGFDTQHILFTNIITARDGSFDQLRQRLLEHPEIEDACMSDYIPFILPGGDDLNWEGASPEEKVFVRFYNVSPDFFSTYRIKLDQGREFSRDSRDGLNVCLINETAARVFGWKNPLGMHINLYDRKMEVIGVVRDFIAFSVHNPNEPHMYRLLSDTGNLSDKIYSIRYAPGKKKEAEAIANEEFSGFFPDDAFAFSHIQGRIQNEAGMKGWSSFRNITIFFALLSIIISSVGLFGLMVFFLKRKMKEIGIRKVLGFSLSRIYLKLSVQFLGYVGISILFAWPVAYLVYKGLPGAHKYGIQIWEFLLATLIVLVVAIITISYNILKAARTNPAEIFKYE